MFVLHIVILASDLQDALAHLIFMQKIFPVICLLQLCCRSANQRVDGRNLKNTVCLIIDRQNPSSVADCEHTFLTVIEHGLNDITLGTLLPDCPRCIERFLHGYLHRFFIRMDMDTL